MPLLLELFAGLAAVSLHALGAKPIVSRIGCKAGYTDAILTLIDRDIDSAVALDRDRPLVSYLRMLAKPEERRNTADRIEGLLTMPARACWELARKTRENSALAWLLWTAGARGGIGGFKGLHKHRPNVDGFIPSRQSLVQRLRNFALRGAFETRAINTRLYTPSVHTVLFGDESLKQVTAVYLDPPYSGRQGYGRGLDDLRESTIVALAKLWATQPKTRVALSWGTPMRIEGFTCHEITAQRRGQTRRSLTRTSREFLLVSNS